MSEKPEKYTICERCGAKILEQVAIEENGQILCGRCVMNAAQKEVDQAKRHADELRQHSNDLQKKERYKQQRKKAVMVLIACLVALVGVQIFTYQNRPQPVKSVTIDFSKDPYTTKALIVMALHEYVANKQILPETLSQLIPAYLPKGYEKAFAYFSYKKIEPQVYDLQISTPSQPQPNKGTPNDSQQVK